MMFGIKIFFIQMEIILMGSDEIGYGLYTKIDNSIRNCRLVYNMNYDQWMMNTNEWRECFPISFIPSLFLIIIIFLW
jgi:hypothetical protein